MTRKEKLLSASAAKEQRANPKLAICTESANRCMLPKTPSKWGQQYTISIHRIRECNFYYYTQTIQLGQYTLHNI